MADGAPGLPRLLTSAEVADVLRISRRQLELLRKARKIAFLPGRPVKFTEAAIRQYLELATIAAAPVAAVEPAKATPPAPAPLTGKQLGARMLLTRQMRGIGKPRG